MEIGEDPEYISFLRHLRLCGSNSHMPENRSDGASSSIGVKYDEINPTCENKPKSERIRHDSRKRRKKTKEGLSGRNLVFRGSDGRTYASDYFNYSSRMKVSEMGTVDSVHDLERRNSSIEEEREMSVEKDAALEGGEEDREIGQMGIDLSSFENSAIQSENESVTAQVAGVAELPMKTDLQGFMLLMKMLCPVEKTIYPVFNSNEVVIGPMGDPSTSNNMEKKPNQEEKRDTSSSSPRGSFNFDWIEEKREEELPGEEMKSRYKKNKRSRIEMEGLAAFPELSDSDGEPKIDEIPVKILRRPPSEYRDKLIKVLKRPFNKSEYRELMNEATLKKRKIVYKELRSRERAMVTNEKSKSIFELYPEVKSQVERATCGRRLTLLRGLFFWLKNCCHDGSFKPWKKGYKGSTVHLTINDSKKLQKNK